MPHVVIKMLPGPSKEAQQKAAKEISEVIENVLGKAQKYTSVSVEEYTLEEWEGVYNEYIKDKDNIVLPPAYTNPRTFE